MLLHFATALVFALMAAAFLFASLLAGRFLRPRRPDPVKAETYECGELPVGPAWINVNLRYYLIALAFVIFDVEAALLFPVAVQLKRFAMNGQGAVAFLEIAIFVAVLVLGLAYVWSKRDLEWIRKRAG